MKKVIIAVTLSLASVAASAQTFTHGWGCRAESRVAYGYSINWSSRDLAIREALRQCAIRTPNTQTCRVVRCYFAG
jgi:hypothetical protein